MKFLFAMLTGAIIIAALLAMLFPAWPEGRAELDACRIMIDRAAQAAPNAASARQDDAALARCRQIVRDWTLRESRMSVDEQGRPLR